MSGKLSNLIKNMPGGSVNGRPFRESVDSYEKTGIPCGNPKRFLSRDVTRMQLGKRPYCEPLAAPTDEVETEGKRQLKILLQKQLKTDTSLQEHFGNKKSFTSGVAHKPAASELSGVVTLDDYQTLQEADNRLEELKRCGLTEEEIQLKLDSEEVGSSGNRRFGMDPAVHRRKMEQIEHKLEERKQVLSKPDEFSGTKQITRHEVELEKSLAASSQKSQFLHDILLSSETKGSDNNSSDPMDHLPDILKTITKRKLPNSTSSGKSDTSEKILGWSEVQIIENVTVNNRISSCDKSSNQDRSCHKQFDEHGQDACRHLPPNTIATCKSHLLDTKQDPCTKISTSKLCINDLTGTNSPCIGPKTKEEHRRELVGIIEAIPEEVIKKYKVSLAEIKLIPRFENYTPGYPNKTLFLKNLSNKITEEDLVALFVRYQKPNGTKIIFKLMSGRMKGQAFVTFDNTETATEALELVNGYKLKGKPIIIQYGKKRDT